LFKEENPFLHKALALVMQIRNAKQRREGEKNAGWRRPSGMKEEKKKFI